MFREGTLSAAIFEQLIDGVPSRYAFLKKLREECTTCNGATGCRHALARLEYVLSRAEQNGYRVTTRYALERVQTEHEQAMDAILDNVLRLLYGQDESVVRAFFEDYKKQLEGPKYRKVRKTI